ncbi:hypothetical protein KUM39_21015 [Streptomyces sp. J2-1]|uniref:hypothetical protein n=1 Tax=Streptomyces corallincola TaxID=2851888 RepID=UPI001C38743A|nr:hypothetical protein [Streptomyces corallincola]MBV2356825.1 hypothetical protein [Streptomyces corallincola]
MIEQVSHPTTTIAPADITLALSVAHALHAPTEAPRPELPPLHVPELMGLRTSADRPHRRKVPLRRLTAMRELSALGV